MARGVGTNTEYRDLVIKKYHGNNRIRKRVEVLNLPNLQFSILLLYRER